MQPRLGFIGLGAMGSPTPRRLLDAGYPLAVYNRTAERPSRWPTPALRSAIRHPGSLSSPTWC